ncbi:hypothetical protein SNOG_08771 [Parastagonospora nodorum SN15]|uniref:Uncharacterized protein n=1 Tax=Phaeosphaeria nodorum (strain SN15 / ATCC MYA-4574 / FGSC 10173) TaxID=321614 RepID=Q0UHJ3_PHANO|nr:hypothetical protein SNOG_08771 [Parastagonospora nodorum SN15]EAT83939.1 hypothetical protein SNOG_08771 [Parastagonospora nodorum SN15]
MSYPILQSLCALSLALLFCLLSCHDAIKMRYKARELTPQGPAKHLRH